MTFYNIIFAILFIAAFQQLLIALLAFDLKEVLMAAILCLLVFSDTIFTCDAIEEKHRPYKTKMKLLDLTSFVLLILAVLVLNPNSKTFQIAESNAPPTLLHDFQRNGLDDPIFWLILTLYWLVLMSWNTDADTYKNIGADRKWCGFQIRYVQRWYAALFGLIFFLALLQYVFPILRATIVAVFLNAIILVLLIAYLFSYKKTLVECMT